MLMGRDLVQRAWHTSMQSLITPPIPSAMCGQQKICRSSSQRWSTSAASCATSPPSSCAAASSCSGTNGRAMPRSLLHRTEMGPRMGTCSRKPTTARTRRMVGRRGPTARTARTVATSGRQWRSSAATRRGCCTTTLSRRTSRRRMPGAAGTSTTARSQVCLLACTAHAAWAWAAHRAAELTRRGLKSRLFLSSWLRQRPLVLGFAQAMPVVQLDTIRAPLAGLTAAMFLPSDKPPSALAAADEVPCPDSLMGLHVRTCGGAVVRVSAKPHQLLFQAGQCLQALSGGRLKATQHYVRGPSQAVPLSRETFAVFCQPKCAPPRSRTAAYPSMRPFTSCGYLCAGVHVWPTPPVSPRRTGHGGVHHAQGCVAVQHGRDTRSAVRP